VALPNELFDIKFDKAVAFGYRTDEVDSYVTKVCEIMKTLDEENEALKQKVAAMVPALDKYREEEESLRSALIGAQKLGESILRESKAKADKIIRQAEETSRSLVEDAHIKAESEKAELVRVRSEVSLFKSQMIEMYKAHIELIKRIPNYEVPAGFVSVSSASAKTAQTEAENKEEIKAEPVQKNEILENQDKFEQESDIKQGIIKESASAESENAASITEEPENNQLSTDEFYDDGIIYPVKKNTKSDEISPDKDETDIGVTRPVPGSSIEKVSFYDDEEQDKPEPRRDTSSKQNSKQKTAYPGLQMEIDDLIISKSVEEENADDDIEPIPEPPKDTSEKTKPRIVLGEDDIPDIPLPDEKKTVISSKYGVLRFGESFKLNDNDR